MYDRGAVDTSLPRVLRGAGHEVLECEATMWPPEEADVCVVELRRDTHVIDRIHRIRQTHPGARIVALTTSLDLQLLEEAVRAGAVPLLYRESVADDLISAIDVLPPAGPVGRPAGGHGHRPTMALVSVVIPAKNESGNIAWVLNGVPDYVDEVILVDGCSTDTTVSEARRIRPDIVVVTEERAGKGAALRAGFARASGEIIVMIDADGSMIPAEIGRLLHLLEEGFDFVKGSRFMAGGSSADITPVRNLGNGFLVLLVNRLWGARFTDLCYGFCAFHRRHLAALDLGTDGFEIETEIVLHALKADLRITEVPSVEQERLSGVSNLRTVRDGLRVLRTILRERFGSAGAVPAPAPVVATLATVETGPRDATVA